MDDKVLQKSVLKDYGETVVTANSSTSYTIDLTEGNVFDITLTGNCAFTFANPPASGVAGSFTLLLKQDATGSRTATWPSAVAWLGGSEPTLSTTGSQMDILTFTTVDEGSTWYGAVVAQGYVLPSGRYIAVVNTTSSPFFTLLDHTTPGAISLATTYTLPGNAYATPFSPDGNYIAVGHAGSPYFTLLDHTTPGAISLAATYTINNTGRGVSFSPN